jgi:hypothetical protein
MAVSAVLATGCAAVTSSSDYAPTATTASGLQVRGELINQTGVKIYVNGQKVIDDQLALLSGEGAFRGTYDGRRVLADCASKPGMQQGKTRCTVAVGNDGALTLTF